MASQPMHACAREDAQHELKQIQIQIESEKPIKVEPRGTKCRCEM